MIDSSAVPHAPAPSNVAAPHCLDCGAPLTGAFCSHCGQPLQARLVPVRQIVREAAAETLSLEGRLFRTVRLLLFRPGFLTSEYLAGRRTRYVAPFRLFLAASALYFAIFYLTGSARFFFIYAGEGNDPDFDSFVRLLPQLMFVLVPIFALMVMAVSPRNGRYYAEFLVFALHFTAVSFLVLPLDAALQGFAAPYASVGDWSPLVILAVAAAGVIELWLFVYLGLALRRVFGGGRIMAGVRAVALLVAYTLLIVAFAIAYVPLLRRAFWEVITSLPGG